MLRSGLRLASQTKVEPLVEFERRLVSIAVFHLRDEVEVIAAALALAVVTEPAVLRKGHFEDVLTGAFMNRARAFEAVTIANAVHAGRQTVMLQHLLKRHSSFDCRKVDECFCHGMIMSCLGVCGMSASCKHLHTSWYQSA